ncbi:hypothetical protein GM3708_1157 [Geminocystis sp. NIES-3708]|uniref:cupin domain-containing protein n=1 Tax=Geminocystis sp. NIES-3708 TaxID=1615909 RepID=UPI0005FC5C45|nr:cupin domain-containing protein [Geminocystis sp. NIES-3708]BAQ60751.1 hypothetical protein GM3708_1157 [Geminocystis sp. NIES-3708]
MSILSIESSFIQIRDYIEYPSLGILSKVLLKDCNCQYTLFCLAEGTKISEHTANRNAIINVLEGEGLLILEEKKITLIQGIFAVIPSNAPHSLHAHTNLSFLLTLSANS